MIPPVFVWREMLRRASASAGSWFALVAFPVLMGIHGSATSGFPVSALGALPASVAAFCCLGWRSSKGRGDLARLLERTPFGRSGLALSETALGVALGSVAGYAALALLPGGSLPWQAWAMPPLASLQVSCISTGLGRRSASLPSSILVVLAALSVIPAPGAFTALLASPGHLPRILGMGTASVHPDMYVASSVLLAAAAVYAEAGTRDRVRRPGGS